MRHAAVLVALLVATGATAQTQPQQWPIVSDPAATSLSLITGLEKDGVGAVAEEMLRLLRRSEGKEGLVNLLRTWDGKHADVVAVAYDRNHGNAVRQVLVYAHYDDKDYPFMYHRFTYKMTKAGWVLTNFQFKSEVSQAFPSDFAIP